MSGCRPGPEPTSSTTEDSTPRSGPTLSAPPLPKRQARRLTPPTDVCRQLAVAALTVDTITTTLAQAWRNAARAHGAPRPRALHDGAARGRDPKQVQWQALQAQVQPTPEDPDLHDVSGQERSRSRAAAAFALTGTARGTAGWTAPDQPGRLKCLLLADPVRGWLVDVVNTQPQPTAPAGPEVRRATPAVG